MQQAYSDDQAQIAEHQRAKTIETVMKSIHKAKEINPGFRQSDEKVFVLGETGVGKSTLINALIGSKLIVKRDWDLFITNSDQNNNHAPIISNQMLSETKFPTKWRDDENSIDYWDLPGFGDVSGPCCDIPQAYYIKSALSFYNQIKVLVVLPQDVFSGRGASFKKIIDHLVPILGDVEDLKDSLHLVISKSSPETAVQMVKGYAMKALEMFSDLSEKHRRIISAICDEKSLITFFHRPEKEGPFISGIREEIANNIKKLKSFSPASISISVPDSSKLFVEDLARAFQQDAEMDLSRIIELIHERIQNEIQRTQEYKEAKDCIDEVKREFEKISQTKDVKELLDVLSPLVKRVLPYHMDLAENFANDLRYIEFSRQIRPNIENHFSVWASKFKEAASKLELLTDMDKQYDESTKTARFKGIILSLQNIASVLQRMYHIENVEIFCYNTLFLDTKLKLPGVNMTIFAPIWIIHPPATIDLRGEEGTICLGRRGIDGRPGAPGKNGGDFSGVGLEFINIEELTIDLDGGPGGKGENGDDGEDGDDGMNGDEKAVLRRDQELLKDRTKLQFKDDKLLFVAEGLLTFNDTFYSEYESSGSKGSDGERAGLGGCGGNGGYPGRIRLIPDRNRKGPKVFANRGAKGEDGCSGLPGKGGKGGKTYYGVYRESIALPTIRGYNKDKSIGGKACSATSTTISAMKTPVAETAVTYATQQTVKKMATETCKGLLKESTEKLLTEGTKEMSKKAIKKAGERIGAQVAQKVTETLGEGALKKVGEGFIKETVVPTLTKTLSTELPQTVSTAAANRIINTATTELGKTASLAGKGAFGVASMAKSLGVNLLIQGAVSGIYELARKGWKVPVTWRVEEDGEDGEVSNEKNKDGLMSPRKKTETVELEGVSKKYKLCQNELTEKLMSENDEEKTVYIIDMDSVLSKL